MLVATGASALTLLIAATLVLVVVVGWDRTVDDGVAFRLSKE